MNLRHILATALVFFSVAAQAAVDVNQASQADLETVKGIGPALSAKILAARQQGAFKDWTDLVDRVGGVGPGNAGRFSQAGLTVAGSAYTGAAAAPAERPARADKVAKADKADKPAKAAKTEKAAAQ